MYAFSYTAKDPKTGQSIKSVLQADSEAAAARLLQSQGLAPLNIKLIDDHKNTMFGVFGKKKIKTKDRIIFSRQLSTLIDAGLPLAQSLHNVNNQTPNGPLKIIITQLISDVEAGMSFSQALAKHPKIFNNIYVSLVAAGEASGTLDKALERIAFQQEKDAEIVAKVRGALMYPLIVVVVMFIVIGFMITKVLPQVEVIYNGIPGAQLPLLTRVLLSISRFSVKYWWVVLIVTGLITYVLIRYTKTGPGREAVDKFKMRSWPIGPLFMKMYMARFARTAGALISSGVPLIQMLEIVAISVNNAHVEKTIRRSIEKVKGGKSLSETLEGDPNFLPLVPSMLKIGEESGSMEKMLDKTAVYYEKEVDDQIKAVSTIIEPVLMIVLGVVAFIIVAAVLLPIYALVGKDIIR